MDKSWILLDRLSPAYKNGVEGFLEFAQSNKRKAKKIPCPCSNCINFSHHPIKKVRYHLFKSDFDENYKVWTFHGEKHPNLDSNCPSTSVPPAFDYTKEMIHDAFTNADEQPEALKSLLEECEKPLYEGSKYNALEGLLKFQHLKGQYGWSNTSFDALLGVLRDVLPPENSIPKSSYEAKKLLKGVGLEYVKYHACENDCTLFWKAVKDASECPRCGTSRWKEKTKNVPRKVVWYFPPISRFKRMFSSPQIAHDLTSHAEGRLNSRKLFGFDSYTYISVSDFETVFTMYKLTASIISAYMMYLYETMKHGTEKDHKICFVSTVAISSAAHMDRTKHGENASRSIANRLSNRKDNNLILMPYNPDDHWDLAALDMDSLTCYYFDSLRPRQPDPDLKQIVDTAIMMYAAQSSSKKRKVLKWVTRVCPLQPGIYECGYCVLKYMKEIVYGGPGVLVDEHFWKLKDKYAEEDFLDVREDWASFVTNFIFKDQNRKR